MDRQEHVREILSVYRPGDPACADARFQDAVQEAEGDRDLGRWFTDDQKVDKILSGKLAFGIPAGLRARVTGQERPVEVRARWMRKTMFAAACLIGLAILFGSWRGPFTPSTSLAEYRDEMVSFVKLDPPLELESTEATGLVSFLKSEGAPSNLAMRGKVADLEPAGCRILRFRGSDVSLVCFRHSEGKIVHLFVVTARALPNFKDKGSVDITEVEGWATAAWKADGHVYLLAAEGDKTFLQRHFTDR